MRLIEFRQIILKHETKSRSETGRDLDKQQVECACCVYIISVGVNGKCEPESSDEIFSLFFKTGFMVDSNLCAF